MGIEDVRIGVRQAIHQEQTTSIYQKAFIHIETAVLFFAVPILGYVIKNGSSEGILLAAFQNFKWLVVLYLAALIIPFVSIRFRRFIAMISIVAVPIIVGILSWNLLHDWFWTILLALVGGFIGLGMNLGCLQWHADMEATDFSKSE